MLGFGEGPAPTLTSMIFKPEGVVVTGWASAASDIAMTPVAVTERAVATAARRDKTRILVRSYG